MIMNFAFRWLSKTAFSQLYLRVSIPCVQWVYLACSEYTSREVYSSLCLFYLLSIRCFNVVQPETRLHFQSANQIAKKGQNFTKFSKNFKFIKFKNKFLKLKICKKFQNIDLKKIKIFIKFQISIIS